MEINPNHPVTSEMRDQWHKVAAILMHKLGLKEIIITEADISAALPEGIVIGAYSRPEGLTIFLTDAQTAEKMVKTEGGLPA